MTLIVSAVEESLSCKSEDEDEIDLSCSPEDKPENVKRHNENNVVAVLHKTLNNNTKLDDVLGNESNAHNLSEDKTELLRSELKISLKNCEKESASPLLIYKCIVSVESSPKLCSTNDKGTETTVNCHNYEVNQDSPDDKGMIKVIECNAADVVNNQVSGLVSLDLKVVDGICKVSSFPSQNIGLTNHIEQPFTERIVEMPISLSSSGQCFDAVSDVEVDLCTELNEPSNSIYNTKLKKLMQRRTVSESNSLELESTKKSIETLRHSFSSSEHCDNVQIDVDFILNKCKYNNKDVLLNSNSGANMDPLMNKVENDPITIPVLKTTPRKSAEITDTLVYNVKKSMIEEYQNLKKENSSLVSDINYSSPDSSVSLVNKYKSHICRNSSISQCSEGCQTNIIESCKLIESADKTPSKNEMNVSKSVAIGIPPCNPEIHQNFKLRDGLIPLSSSLDSDQIFEPTLNGCHKSSDSDTHGEDKSSPPSRLETWKNLLAEKRNSLKSHLKDITKGGEVHNEILDINDHNTYNDSNVFMKECNENSSKCSNPVTVNQNYIDNYVVGARIETCDNFVKVSAAKISTCSETSNDSNVKSKFQDACLDIAEALYSIPVMTRSDMENNNGIISTDSFVNKVQIQEACVQTCLSSDIGCEKKNIPKLESNLSAIITTIKPPILNELMCNEKCQQCPTPPPEIVDCEKDSADETKEKGSAFTSSEEDSDYCQTDECGDDCDYCSGEDAEDEEDDTCNLCRQSRSLSPVCKHTRVMTNGSLRRQRLYDENGTPPRLNGSRSLVIQAALRRRRLNTQELCAIREYSITSDEQLDSDEDQSQDDNMCDLSSSWRFGLCREPVISRESTLRSNRSVASLPCVDKKLEVKLKSNSLPVSSLRNSLTKEYSKRPGSAIIKTTSNSDDEGIYVTGINFPRRPPRVPKNRHYSCNLSYSKAVPLSIQKNLRPTMGLQGLQQRPSSSRLTHTGGYPTGPKTLAPRSPLNPNPPFGFPNPPSLPISCPGGSPLLGRRGQPLEVAGPPGSPRTCSRSGALVTRNFSISDDEGGQRLSRRQVTITRHESAYKEAADKGYHIAPCSPVDPYWLTWKLGVLQKTLEDVSSRLEESEKVVATWGPIPHDSNLADQHVHNVRKFRENISDLQRGVDDVNDQAARFSAHNIPLTPQNSAALHDLNNRWKNLETTVNDRWRQVAGRSREVTPLTPAQLASSVNPPWERATATNKVPYYINHSQETTHWDHPIMMDLLDSLADYNHIKFSAYRTASKLRSLQKKLSLDRAKLQLVTDVFDEHGLRGQNDRLIDVNDMIVVLSTLYGRISADHIDVNTTIATDLCLNWLLNVYDSQRTGQMRVLSFRVGLICLCRGHLEEKYRYMFRLIADPNRLVDQRKLGLLLHDCVQVPRQLGEVAAFGGSNIEPSVRSCFTKAGKDRENIEAVHFLTWVQQEPQSLVWLAVLHRVAASESVQHQVKCNICKTYPITGLRYRCLKCLSFDMCQRCFFDGRSSKSHKITHPMHEYCTATTAGDEMKDFTKALKNKFKSKRSLQKHTKKGYLPVQTVLEGDPLESPSPSPSHNVSSQDMHSRLELYASRLAEVELRTNSNSTPDSEDEHGLIAQYCQSLSSSDAPFPVPKSPLQIMASVDADQKDELEQMIRDLEEENQALQAEYERLKSQQPTGSALDDGMGQRSEAEMLAEAKLLREHKGRLEARMSILEDHNRQLEAQLQRLRQLLVEQQGGMGSPNKSGTLQTKSVTASQLAMDSPAKINGHSSHGDLEKAVGNLVDSMNQERANDSRSDDNSDENDYDNTGINQASSIS